MAPPEIEEPAHESNEAEDSPWADLGRLISLSDGIFAFAMTLLVIELVVPSPPSALGGAALEKWLHGQLGADLPALLGYVFAFTMIAIWWMSHQRLFLRVRRVDQLFQWVNMLFLLTISVTPFVLGVLIAGNDAGTFLGAGLFLGTESLSSLLLTGMWYYATEGHRLVDPNLSSRVIERSRAITLSRTGIFLGAFAIAFIQPSWGLDALGLIYVFQVIQARRRRDEPPRGPILTLIHALRDRKRSTPRSGPSPLPDANRSRN